MGELLLCREPIAALPYYTEEIGQNLYSMEELNYYIAGNSYLLDASFMNEGLCTWIEQQMKRFKLAQRLRELLYGGKLSDFVFAILEDTGYCTMQEMQDIVFAVRQMEERSDFECSKLRADQLLVREKYLAAVYAYKRLLDDEDCSRADPVLRGNIRHNLGTAYARQFLFEEAARCYELAYADNASGESLRECLFCYLGMQDEERFCGTAERFGIDETGRAEIRNAFSQAKENGELTQKLRERPPQEQLRAVVFQWKENYRKNCRV